MVKKEEVSNNFSNTGLLLTALLDLERKIAFKELAS